MIGSPFLPSLWAPRKRSWDWQRQWGGEEEKAGAPLLGDTPPLAQRWKCPERCPHLDWKASSAFAPPTSGCGRLTLPPPSQPVWGTSGEPAGLP